MTSADTHRNGKRTTDLATVLVLVAGLLVFGALPARAAEPKAVDRAKDLIVMVRGGLGESEILGAGIIVGTRADRLYVATANHLVRRGVQEAEELRIEIRFLRGETFAANLLESHDTALDLAVLNVPDVSRHKIPVDLLHFDVLGEPGELERGAEVFHVGNPNGRKWRSFVQADPVSEVLSHELRFDSSYIAPGSSGGGLFDRSWRLVGMLRADEPPEGIAVPIDRVVERLRTWGYPVALEPRGKATAAAGSTPVATPCAGRKAEVKLRSQPTQVTIGELRKALAERGMTVSQQEGLLSVSGGLANRFEPIGDFVADCTTGRMWQRGTSGPFSPDQAQQYVEKLNAERHGGFDDWRVPTAEELASLTQASGVEVASLTVPLFLDPRFFDSRGYYCQSSDRVTDPTYKGHVLIITWAGQGSFGAMPANESYPVRAVRTLR